MLEIEITMRRNGEVNATLSGDQAQFTALVAEHPENLLSRALVMNTGDPARPGRVLDWLLPGWKFDIDYRLDDAGRLLEMVINVLEPKRRN
jgi:hypothetical protein